MMCLLKKHGVFKEEFGVLLITKFGPISIFLH